MIQKAQTTKPTKNKLLPYAIWVIVIWTVILAALLANDLRLLTEATQNLAMREAEAHFQKDEAFRFWSATHGGFYVFTDEHTPPSPYLKHISERDIETPSGRKLTLMNPAYALRQMLDDYEDTYGIGGHITSLQPLRPENSPDDWERNALISFENGDTISSEFTKLNGEHHLRYMEPLVTQQGCLKCHEHQGYVVGDIRGGVSVSVPLSSYLVQEQKASFAHILSFAALWLLGIIGVLISYRINKKSIYKEEHAQMLLQESHNQLESKVVERTSDLQSEIDNHKKTMDQLVGSNQQLLDNEQKLKITNQQLHENQEIIKINEERYKGIIDSTASCIAVYKPTEDGQDFIFVDFNPMAEKLEKLSKKDVIGKKVTEVFPGIEKFGLLQVFRDVNKSGIPQYFPISFYIDDKNQGYRDNNVYKISTGEIVAVYQDVTETVVAKNELQLERDKLISIFESMVDGIYIINKDFDIEYVNSALIKDFGAVGDKKCHEYFHNNDKPCSFCKNKEVFDGKTIHWEWTSPINSKTYDLIDTPLYNADGSISKLEIFRDITERNVIDKKLQESEERYRLMTKNTLDTIWTTDLNLKTTFINNAVFNFLGYTPEEFIGHNPLVFTTPEGIEILQTFTENLIANYKLGIINQSRTELQHIKKDGTVIDAELWAHVLLNGKGELIGFQGRSIDITDRKKDEDRLLKLSTAVTQSPSVIAITDIKGNLEYVNPRFTELTGYTFEEALGINPRILRSGLQPDDVYKDLWETIKEGKDWHGEFHNKKKNGETFWESAKISPIIDNKGNITSYIKVAEDITERKRNEQIQKVLYQISNATTTTSTLEELIGKIQIALGTIIDTSNFFVALYNPETDMLSLPYYADDKDKFTSVPAAKTLTKYVIESKKSLLATSEFTNKLVKDGLIEHQGSKSKLWLGVPLKAEGKIIGVFAVQSYTDENAFTISDMKMLEFVSDQIGISIERKKAEENLKSALKKATESARLKSAFLATMSHELRTPLNAIIGFSELINDSWPMDEIIGFAKTINSSGTHLLSIVNDIFDITLIEAGVSKINNHEIDLIKVLNEINEIVKSEQKILLKENLNLELILPDSSEMILFTDSFKLKQILINLIKNALKFTKDGYVRYGFEIEADSNKQLFIKFFVEDTGIGIAEENKELIFETFRQVDDSYTRTFGGTGIGLSISKKLTELLGGSIWFDSKINKGTTFYFTIPYIKVNIINKPIVIKQKSNNNLLNKTILIVEDDDDSFEFLNIVLKQSGAKALWAKNGEESIIMCKRNASIDIVLMDINMDVMNGYIATEEIKKFRPELPIIAQTALALAGDKEKALKAGCDDYITKPINKHKLIEMLNKY